MADQKKNKSYAELIHQVGAKAREQKKRTEQIALAITLTFFVCVALVAWFTDGRVFTAPWNFVMSFEEAGKSVRAPGLNCSKPKNKNTPYCIERRAKIEATWHGISRHGRGKSSSFTLHDK